MSQRLPKLIAFDLDYTLWDLWCDTHVTPPLKRKGQAINEIVDRHGTAVSFYRDVPAILWQLKQANIVVAACSRTHAPPVARQMLEQLLIPAGEGKTITAMSVFDELEIYPGSKLQHFKSLHEKTGIAYSEMLFFDDEARNREVERLGVTMILVPGGGTTRKLFEGGLAEWRRRHPEA